METKVTIKLTQQEKLDIITGAIEGNAIYYWAGEYGRILVDRDANGNITLAEFFADDENEEKKKFRVTPATIQRGINKLFEIEVSPAIRAQVLANENDSVSSDLIIQAGLFGKIVYA